MTRSFKGVWIPKSIWENTDLNCTERCFLAEIDSLTGENGCYASRDFFAERMGVSKQHITDMLTKLRKLNLIVDVSFDGRTKVIAPAWSSDGSWQGVMPTAIPVVSLREKPWYNTIYKENNLDNSKNFKTVNTEEDVEDVIESDSLQEHLKNKEIMHAKKKYGWKSISGDPKKYQPYQKKPFTVADGRGIR